MKERLFTAIVAAALATACAPGGEAPKAEPPKPAARPDIELIRDFRVVAARVSARATLASVLRAHHVADGEIAAAVACAASVFDLRKVRTAQAYRIEQGTDGALRRFEYEIDGDRFLRVTREADRGTDGHTTLSARPRGYVAEVVPIEKSGTVEIVRGTIDRGTPSLVAAMDAAGETVDLSLSLAEIFNGEIDFNVDIQKGDHFELLVEKQFRIAERPTEEADRLGAGAPEEKVFAGYGPILAAEFVNAGRTFRAVRFMPQGSTTAAYYDERGLSMRRFFLQSPLKFVPVISSGFSRSRFHPILREYRAHLGVDYKAPAGAPVVAVANGVVVEAGAKGGSGRMVHLRHANGFESEYLHLSAIAVRVGARVRQGALIGRVGATGLATGPHLDYRLKKNGVFINPVTARRSMPPGEPVPAAQMAAFGAARDRVLVALTSAPVTRTSAPVTAPQQ